MKKAIVLLILAFASVVLAQKPPVKVVKTTTQAVTVTEFSAGEWKILTDNLEAEDWTKAATIAAQYLQKLKTDNDKKQLAQLRYLRLFALAGKILAIPATDVPVNDDALWKELDDAASEFNGKEFVLPPHRYLSACVSGSKRAANYICPVTGDNHALRVTATNKEGTAIHSFDYIVFDDVKPLNNLPESELFVGGTLKRIEYNQDSTKPWVMRLTYEKGFISTTHQ